MKLTYNRTFRENDRMLMRRCGYFENYDRRTRQTSYIRQLHRTPYPRFHVYINKSTSQSIEINLHLDAKKPIYEGFHAHAGEYDSEVVMAEAERITGLIRTI